jgi:hypothetical protein
MKQEFVVSIRAALHRYQLSGWQSKQQAGLVFEELCVPGGDTFPDDPIMEHPDNDNVAAMWAFIISAQGQAESGSGGEGYHHDYAEAIAVTLVATAHVLAGLPLEDSRVVRFQSISGMTPQEFLDRYV